MKVNIDSLSSVKKKINVLMPKSTIDEKFDKAYDSIRRKAKIKGFRSGKAPRNIIKKYYGEQVAEDVLREVLQESYPQVIKDEDIKPVSFPHYGGEKLKEGEDFSFSFTVDVKPEIDLQNYKGISLVRESTEVSDQDIAEELNRLQSKFATKNPVTDRPVKKGDQVTFDFEPFGKVAEEDTLKGKNQTLEIGAGRFVPAFEEAMIGLEKGEIKDIKVPFPSDYHNEDFAGKESLYRVNIKEIHTVELPPLDDEFAKNVAGFESLSELKDGIKEDLKLSNEQTSQNKIEREIVDAILKENQFHVPTSMVEEQYKFKKEDAKKRMLSLGMKPESLDLNLKEIEGELHKESERDVKAGLLIGAIAEKEGIDVSEDDMDNYYKEMSENVGKPVDEIKKFFDGKRDRLIGTIIDKKVVEFLLSVAKIEEK